MILEDLLDKCMEPGDLRVALYDCEEDATVWKGFACDAPEEYLAREVSTFDVPDKPGWLTINLE